MALSAASNGVISRGSHRCWEGGSFKQTGIQSRSSFEQITYRSSDVDDGKGLSIGVMFSIYRSV